MHLKQVRDNLYAQLTVTHASKTSQYASLFEIS